LDAGARVIIAPPRHSGGQACEVVRAANFAPTGERLLPNAIPHLRFRTLPVPAAMAAINGAAAVAIVSRIAPSA